MLGIYFCSQPQIIASANLAHCSISINKRVHKTRMHVDLIQRQIVWMAIFDYEDISGLTYCTLDLCNVWVIYNIPIGL